MSADWLSYHLSDYMLFNQRVYARMLEGFHYQFWPWQFVAVALGLLTIYLCSSPSRLGNRIISLLLGAAWLFCGWFYLWKSYVVINWTAYLFVYMFIVQGLAFLFVAATRDGFDFNKPKGQYVWIFFGLMFCLVLVAPILTHLIAPPLLTMEIVGMTPNPTVLATFFILLLSRKIWSPLFMIVPIIWSWYSVIVVYLIAVY